MIYVHFIFAVLAFAAANYVNIVTFCVIHRMRKCTPWNIAGSFIAAAAIGSYTWIKSFSYMMGLSMDLPLVSSILTIAMAALLAVMPRIDVDPHHRMKVH